MVQASSTMPSPDAAAAKEKLLVNGVVRVLRNRQTAGKGPLPIEDLAAEFQAFWKMAEPVRLLRMWSSVDGATDPTCLLRKWPSKVLVVTVGDRTTVQLALAPMDLG